MTAPAKPTTPFDSTKITFGVKTFAVFTPTGESAVNFVGKLLDDEYKLETVDRKVPDANGVLRADESFTLVDLEEIDEIIAAVAKTAIVAGSVQLFICDPADAVNTVRWLSDAFSCTMHVKSGTSKFGGGDYAKMSLTFVSNKGSAGPVTWTPKAATT